MLARSFGIFGVWILVATTLPAAAQSTAGGGSSAQISPIRVEFTRPGGMPGSARDIAAFKSGYMIAPAQPDAPAASKRRVRR